MIRRLTLGCQSDICPAQLTRRLEAAKCIGLAESLAAQAYLRVSMTECPRGDQK
jgi:hypothetical protein